MLRISRLISQQALADEREKDWHMMSGELENGWDTRLQVGLRLICLGCSSTSLFGFWWLRELEPCR